MPLSCSLQVSHIYSTAEIECEGWRAKPSLVCTECTRAEASCVTHNVTSVQHYRGVSKHSTAIPPNASAALTDMQQAAPTVLAVARADLWPQHAPSIGGDRVAAHLHQLLDDVVRRGLGRTADARH